MSFNGAEYQKKLSILLKIDYFIKFLYVVHIFILCVNSLATGKCQTPLESIVRRVFCAPFLLHFCTAFQNQSFMRIFIVFENIRHTMATSSAV